MIADSYKRWRHGRGFGVHSPFAYRFVNDIVRTRRGYGYYAGPELEYLLKGRPRRDRQFWRMVFRIGARLNLKSLYLPHDAPALPAEVLKKAMPRLHTLRRLPHLLPGGLLIIADATQMAEELAVTLKRPDTCLIIRKLKSNPAALANAIAEMTGGWTFEAPDTAILVSSNETGLNRLTINLP